MVGEAPGAVIVIVFPLGRLIPIWGKPGPLNTRVSLPEFCGYMPSISQTKAELFAPRSSLSGSPLGPGRYIVLRMLLTACWVPAGSCA